MTRTSTDNTGTPKQSKSAAVNPPAIKKTFGSTGIRTKVRSLVYPEAPNRGGVNEIIHGVEISDPWRALEHLDTEATRKYISQQNELSIPILRNHHRRKELEVAVEHCLAKQKCTPPELQSDGYYYWLFISGSQPRDVMLRSKHVQRDFGKPPPYILTATREEGGNESGPEVFLDLNQEENVSLYAYGWSCTGRYFTVILQESGSDWQTLRTIDTTCKQVIEPELRHSKFTFGATYIGDRGFFYKAAIDKVYSDRVTELEAADGHFALFFHTLGTAQKTDVIVWRGTGVGGPDRFFGMPRVCASGYGQRERTWVMLDVYRNTNPETETLFFEITLPDGTGAIDMGERLAEWIKSARWTSKGYTGETTYIGTLTGDTHLFKSTCDGYTAGRVMTLDSSTYDNTPPGETVTLNQVVPVDAQGHQLHSVNLVGDSILVLVYLQHACASVRYFDARRGTPLGITDPHGIKGDIGTSIQSEEIPVPSEEIETEYVEGQAVIIPKHGSISSISSKSDARDFYIAINTFISPPYVIRGDLHQSTKTGTKKIILSAMNWDQSPDDLDLICDQVFYPSHDGVQIPLFICHASDLDLTEPQPTLIYGYGGFAHPVLPHHNPFFATFMQSLRGIVAIACIRGGGEYGQAWHSAAQGIKRHVAFDDFAWAAKYLQQDLKLTVPSMTGIHGSSNGGLLVSACLVRNPQLYGCVLADVPLTDLLRFHRFTLGWIWKSEYGDPDTDDPSIFKGILANSPLHNVDHDNDSGVKVEYPSVLITTADHDDRVVPSHALKFLAELQYRKKGNEKPILGRIYKNAGHEMGSKATKAKVEEIVDRLIFYLDTVAS